MAKQVMQFRYYSEDNDKNYPAGINKANLKSGEIFSEYYPIIQLGMQSLPGLNFYLNNSNTSVIIGSTGIYELDLEGYAEVNKLSIDEFSLDLINNNPSAYLIVDVISEKQGANN